MFKNILIPQDGSSHSRSALAYGLFLAKKFDAVLIGHYVVDTIALEGPFFHDLSGSLGFEPFLNFSSKMKDVLEEKGKKILKDFKEVCSKEKIKSETILDSGIVSNEICERARIADLIVLGRKGVNVRFEHGLLGSTTEGVIRKAPKPVMVVSDRVENIEKPLFVYDGSYTSSRVMSTAAEFVKVLGLPLTVLAVSKDRGDELLRDAGEYLRPYSLKVDFVLLKGEIPEDIVEYFNKNVHDLLFIGTSVHGRILEMVLGSTTEFILRMIDKPILLER